MKKKILILLTTCLLACVGLFAACGGDGGEKPTPPTPPTPEITYYTVTFAGEGVTSSSVQVEQGKTVEKPTDPVREGFTFDGWFAEGAQSAFVFTTPIDKDITLTARWTEQKEEQTVFVVTFGGEGVESFTQNVNKGETALEPDDPVRNGYDFVGWFAEGASEKFDFETEIVADITLTAHWAVSADISGSGTKEDPYIIMNSDHLVSFSDRVNSGEEGFYNAWFRLDADVDMQGVKYIPAGRVLVLNEGEENETTIQGFSGVFDGNGHTISNLTIERPIKRGIQFLGLFGRTYMAYIHDLKLENVYLKAETFSDDSQIGVYLGGVVGGAVLTNFQNISVIGEIHTCVLPQNPVKIGGLAGGLSVDSVDGQSYISYVENCYTNIQSVIDEDEYGEPGSLDDAALGGLFGYVSTSNSAAAIINCKTEGKIYGGEFVGGLVGSVGSYISIIDSSSSARVEATCEEVSYAGGLVGSLNGDSVLMDCFATGRVVGKRAKSQYFQSYVGGLVGYSRSDDYDISYTPGAVIMNCHYSGAVSANGANKNGEGIVQEKGTFTKEWILNNLNWHEQCWNFEGVLPVPTTVVASDIGQSFTVTLTDKHNPTEELQRGYTPERGYPMIGEVKDRINVAPELFWNWELTDGISYRFYIPVVKDMNLTAKWYDVTEIAKLYSGTATLHETIDAGIISLEKDGYMQWITDSVVTGKYKYDGQHILFEMDSNTGFVSGTLQNGQFEFIVSAGMSGDVAYSFGEYEGKIIGEYFSENGDILTFGKMGLVSYQSTDLNNDRYMKGKYTLDESGTILTVKGNGYSGKELDHLFSEMKIELLNDGTLRVNFKCRSVGGYELKDVIFRQINQRDYSGKKFVGEYNYANPSYSSSSIYQSDYIIILNDDGTMIYRTAFSDTAGRYFYFEQDGKIKIILEGYASTLYFDSEANILHGKMNRGTMANNPTVLVPTSQGKLKVFIHAVSNGIEHEGDLLVYITDTAKYMINCGVYVPNANIQGTFKNGTIVTIEGVQYFAFEYALKDYSGYEIVQIGEERGNYTNGSQTIELDGIGNVKNGEKTGKYNVYEDGLVVILYDDDTFFAFDYQQALKNGNVATEKQQDGFQGIWFQDRMKINNADEEVLWKKYYKFAVDGFGHATLYYFNEDENQYNFNWGASAMYDGWGTYKKTATGITCQFNEIQFADVVFYYDNQLAFGKHFAYMEDAAFYKEGYTGEMTPPVLPEKWAGSFEGTTELGTEKLQLRGDCSGIYSGKSFVGIYDGKNTIHFSVNDIHYTIVFTDDSNLTLKSETKEYSFHKTGTAVDVIPAGLAGIWKGSICRGNSTTIPATYELRTNGTVLYNGNALTNVAYDSETTTVTGKCMLGENNNFTSISLEWNTKDNTLSVMMRDEENTEYTGVLSK